MATFADRLKELRKSKSVTQKYMADMLNLTERTYRHYEAGGIDPPTSKTQMLADYFEVSIDYLLGRSDEPTPTGNELFAQRLTECRKEKNVTEEAVAEYLGISVTLYCKYETAILEPNISMLNKLAEYFKTSVDYLVGYEPSDGI